jgi:hypothetical protein
MNGKDATAKKEAALKAIRDEFRGTATDTQCKRLLAALRGSAITTFEASRFLDVYHPAGRVKDLRNDGHQITTLRQQVRTEANVRHIVGLYLLVREAGDGGTE